MFGRRVYWTYPKPRFRLGYPRIDSKDLLSDGEVAKATLTAEKEVLNNSGSLEEAGILRKSSIINTDEEENNTG